MDEVDGDESELDILPTKQRGDQAYKEGRR